MPELPEVETTRRGIEPVLLGRRVRRLVVRERRLRWPMDPRLEQILAGQRALAVERRAKYLLLRFERGTLLVHLGMSGSLRGLGPRPAAAGPHDHYDLELDDGTVLRYHDPRRFGCAVWIEGDPARHPLLAELGPEPFDAAFDGDHLYRLSRGRRAPVKTFLMDGHVVVGVGNIYASESLFQAGIDPRRAAGRVSLERYRGLAGAVRAILRESIERGGTTLRDYVNGSGEPGWFGLSLRVYGRQGEACPGCGTAVRHCVLGQRSSFFCPACQR
jgi:formamidopyrimidine-DNA glycosylase